LPDVLEMMRDLRARCEWDAQQTHDSLRPYLIEEAYELDSAIQQGQDQHLKEELGDLLLQVLFHSVLAEERKAFGFRDVATALITKMRGRHPHLYGDGVKEPWEKMKAKKRAAISDGLPEPLPALHMAHRLQDRAGGVGFDWPDVQGPLAKVKEELGEVESALRSAPVEISPSGAPVLDQRHAEIEMELGDLLFACVNLCRKAGVHASLALDKANQKFTRRFTRMEELARADGVDVGSAGLELLDSFWNVVKAAEKQETAAERSPEAPAGPATGAAG
jgi:MazG family protein